VEHLDALLGLELGNLLRDRRRREVQQIGRGDDPAGPVDGKENTKPFRVKNHVAMLHGVWSLIRLC